MGARLLCDAIPFCYGPAAALESFLHAFLSKVASPPEIDILATGQTRELLERAQFPANLLHIDSEDPASLAAFSFHSYDAFLNVCNPVSFSFAKAAGLRVAYLDFLLWMFKGPSAEYFDADLYLAENYPGTAAWVEQRGGDIRNLIVIPPLIKRRPRAAEPHRLLVGLGGLYSRLTIPGENTNYVPVVLRALLAALPTKRFSEVLIAGPSRIDESVSDFISDRPEVRYASLSHNEFIVELARCQAFVSHPGLYAAFEAMQSGVPTAFLPPSNYTQALQLRHYRALGLADYSFSWEDAGFEAIPDTLPEADGVRAILGIIHRAEDSLAAHDALQSTMSAFFSHNSASLEQIGERQRQLVEVFGADGPRVAAEHFVRWWMRT